MFYTKIHYCSMSFTKVAQEEEKEEMNELKPRTSTKTTKTSKTSCKRNSKENKYLMPSCLSRVQNAANSNWTSFFENPQKRPHSSHALSPISPLSPHTPHTPLTPHTPNSLYASREIMTILNSHWEESSSVTEENDVLFGNFEIEKCHAPALEENLM